MKTVREMFVSLTTMLINHIWASIIEICIEKWRTQTLRKLKFKCPDMRNGIDLRRCPHLSNVGRAVFQGLGSDKEAIWPMQGWLFMFDQVDDKTNCFCFWQ